MGTRCSSYRYAYFWGQRWNVSILLLSNQDASILTSLCVKDDRLVVCAEGLPDLVDVIVHIFYTVGADRAEHGGDDEGRDLTARLADLLGGGVEPNVEL